MTPQEVRDIFGPEFNDLNCEVSVTKHETQPGYFMCRAQPRAFSTVSAELVFGPGMARTEVREKRIQLVKQVFAGVAAERLEQQLRNELDAAKARIVELETEKAELDKLVLEAEQRAIQVMGDSITQKAAELREAAAGQVPTVDTDDDDMDRRLAATRKPRQKGR